MCMARRKAALPSMVLTPRPSLAEFRAAPFVVNALEQDIRYRAQDREDEADANGRQPEVSVDRERQDGEAEIRQHRHHAETREDAGIEEKRIRPEAGQVRRMTTMYNDVTSTIGMASQSNRVSAFSSAIMT